MTINYLRHLGIKVGNNFFAELSKEGISYDSGEVRVTVSVNEIKGEDIFIKKAKRLTKGRIIYTPKRFIALVTGYKIIDVPLDSAAYLNLKIDRSNPKRYGMSIDINRSNIKADFKLSYHINPEEVSN